MFSFRWKSMFLKSHLLFCTRSVSRLYCAYIVILRLDRTLINGDDAVVDIAGLVGILWCLLWWWVVKDSPEDDRKITDAELEYLRTAIGVSTQVNHDY